MTAADGGEGLRARVVVTLKPGVLDPQGKAIEGALRSLGVEGVVSVRQGKVFDVTLSHTDTGAGQAALASACEKLLANTVIEDFAVTVTHGLPAHDPAP